MHYARKTGILTALSSKVEAAAIQGSANQKSKAPAGHKQTSQQCSNPIQNV
jgi:hypothetical protein